MHVLRLSRVLKRANPRARREKWSKAPSMEVPGSTASGWLRRHREATRSERAAENREAKATA